MPARIPNGTIFATPQTPGQISGYRAFPGGYDAFRRAAQTAYEAPPPPKDPLAQFRGTTAQKKPMPRPAANPKPPRRLPRGTYR